MKKIVFFSNYLNHHQMPLADAFYERLVAKASGTEFLAAC